VINFYSLGFVQSSGMLQPSGYQTPPPLPLFNGGGDQPTFTPLQLPQQGMNHMIILSHVQLCYQLQKNWSSFLACLHAVMYVKICGLYLTPCIYQKKDWSFQPLSGYAEEFGS